MDLDKTFGTDANLEETGVWIELDKTSSIKIARMGNKRSKEMATRLNKSAKIANKYSLSDVGEDDLTDIIAHTVIIDWKGIKLKGQELPFSVENAKKVLKEYKDFRGLILELSTEMETFRKIEIEEGKENLKKS
ncbi:hypothetical protein EKK58_10545 [Candidatus Dependentiae bacterium]|nr:MAG: hypothetical protein EKK58_10545 [Candidatus Dependentiae bacterium]